MAVEQVWWCGGGGGCGGVAGLHVLRVRHGELLTLVARQLDGFAHLGRDGALVATLTQQRVNGLDAIPACKHTLLYRAHALSKERLQCITPYWKQ